MKGGKRPLGYTIVEVMIVLAVSGIMFLIAAVFISGKQERTTFTAWTNEFSSQLQTIISQVAEGQYSDVSFSCSDTGSGLSIGPAAIGVAANGSNGSQGTNSSCVFLGKFLTFTLNSSPTTYKVYAMAGSRSGTGAGSTINTAYATPVVATGGTPDLTAQNIVPQSLKITDITVTTPAGATHAVQQGFGFIQCLGDAPGGCSGSQEISMVYAPSLTATSSLPNALVQSGLTSPLAYASSAQICISDSTRTALITLGDSNGGSSQLSANIEVKPCS